MAVDHGKAATVLLDNLDMSAYLTSASKSIPVEIGDVSGFTNVGHSKQFLTGLNEGTISFEGLVEDGFYGMDQQLLAVFQTVSGTRFVTVLPDRVQFPNLTTAWLAGGFFTSWDVSSPVADVVSVSAEFQADGGVLTGTSLRQIADGGLAAGGAGPSHDNGVATSNGMVTHCHVTVNSRSTSTDINITHSPDNTNFVTLPGSFFTVAAGNSVRARWVIDKGVTIDRYVRGFYTLTAGTGTITFNLSYARR